MTHLSVAREHHRADFGSVVCFVESVDASTANRVPQFNRSVQTAGGVHFGRRRILHTSHARLMLLRWYGADKALGRIDVIHAKHVVIRANGHIITGRMECETSNGLAILFIFQRTKLFNYYFHIIRIQTSLTNRKHFVSLFHRCLGNVEQFHGTISRSGRQNLFFWMELQK